MIIALWCVTSCQLKGECWRFGGISWVLLQDWRRKQVIQKIWINQVYKTARRNVAEGRIVDWAKADTNIVIPFEVTSRFVKTEGDRSKDGYERRGNRLDHKFGRRRERRWRRRQRKQYANRKLTFWSRKSVQMVYTIIVPTSQKAHCCHITKSSRFTVTAYRENHAKPTPTFHGRSL